MREAGPSPLPAHPWQLKQVPLPSYSRFPYRMISAEASFEYPSKGEINFLAAPLSCAGTRGFKGSFSLLRLYEGEGSTSWDFVEGENVQAKRMSVNTKRSVRRTNGDLEKVMSHTEMKSFLSWPRSLA